MEIVNNTFNKEKSINALLYFASRVERSDFHKIFKLLYFSDRLHLAKYGTPITGDLYIAMDDGPVPSKIYDILKMVRGDSYYKDSEGFSKLMAVDNWMYITPKKEADLRKLSKNNLYVMNECLENYGDLSFDEIREKSHDTAWRSTAKNYVISLDDMSMEAGVHQDELDYVHENYKMQSFLNK